MRVGINPISNSSQRTQQKQQSFGAFTHTQPIEELMPLIRRAQQVKIDIFSPDDVVTAIENAPRYKVSLPDEVKELFEKLTRGYVFNERDKQDLHTASIKSFNHHKDLQDKAKELMSKANPLPLKELEESVTLLEEKATEIASNFATMKNLRLQLSAAELKQAENIDLVQDKCSELTKLGF